jgi:SanA protein
MTRRRFYRLALAGMVGVVALPFLWRWWVHWRYDQHIYSPEEVRQERVAIVFGARIYADGRLSPMLRDRVERAVQLYEEGKVDKLLLSGDNRTADYDEPGRMMDYALSRGVPAEDMQPDYAGRRTFDTCYRAREIFGLDSAVLVTQEFHLPRALFTCNQLGMDVVGVAADLQPYSRRSLAWSSTREIPALLVALIDVIRQVPPPVLGEPIPID